jgi:hypothetical protein
MGKIMMNAKKTIESLKKGQTAYEKVVNQELHYVYLNEKTNTYDELVFKPHKHNFLHLCGINYYDSGKEVNANQFYDFLKQDRINNDGIQKKVYADQKLLIIAKLEDLLDCNELRIIDERAVYLKLVFEKAIRSRRQVFGLCLENDRSGAYFPLSLLNLKSNPKAAPLKKGHPVHCIYSVDSTTRTIRIICNNTDFEEYEKKHTYTYKGVPQRT